MKNIWIMSLEPIETRYTCQWFDGIPTLLKEESKKRNIDVQVRNIHGDLTSTKKTTPGAFLDFVGTNLWKNEQTNYLAREFSIGGVKPGDAVLFTDAWHPGIIQVKYMSELMDIPVEIHAMWHAGSYDPQDFLGRKIKDKRWSLTFERSLYEAIDYSYFATNFHIDLFNKNVLPNKELNKNIDFGQLLKNIILNDFGKKAIRSGQPHNALVEQLKDYEGLEKRDLILFPHRIAPEKQPEIFRDLAESLPEYEWIICQEQNLTKHEYHTLLGESKMVFSANLQETLGISAMEAILLDSFPLVPNRLSYAEMYDSVFKYESKWTENWDSYLKFKVDIINHIRYVMGNNFNRKISEQKEILLKDYLSAHEMVDCLLKKER